MDDGQALKDQKHSFESGSGNAVPSEPGPLRLARSLSSQSPDPAFADALTWPDYWSGAKTIAPGTAITSEPVKTIETVLAKPDLEEILPNPIEIETESEGAEMIPELQAEDHTILQENLGVKPETRIEPQPQDLPKPLSGPPPVVHPKAVKPPITRAKKKKLIPDAGIPDESEKAEIPAVVRDSRSDKKEPPPSKSAKDFYQWLEGLPGAEESMRTAVSPSKKTVREKVLKKSDAVQAAEDSLKLGESVASETLARLLTRQGHKEEAIAMYEKLTVKFPEKRATFAAAIEKLKS
ncbi:MAG TPA: hypothetical protein VFX48_02945 [Saprospiraceae bacterium]|nr:hypothetical protein [Saprospiraceae bacterium]